MKRYLLLAILGSVGILVAAAALIALLVAESPHNDGAAAEAHALQGITLMRQHLYRAAIDEFEAATRESPRALSPWLGLAAAHIRLGDAPRALEGAVKAADIARNSLDAQLILGRAHWLARNFNDAEKAALAADALDPSGRQAAADLLLHIYSDRDDVAKFNEVFSRIENPSRSIQDLAVQFAIRRGEFRRAYDLRTRFERKALEGEVLRQQLTLRREPDRIEIYPTLVKNLVSLGRLEDAIAASRQYRGSARLDMDLGRAYWQAGNRGEAIRAYSGALADRRLKLTAEAALAALTGDRGHWMEAFRAEWIEKDYFVLAQLEEVLKNAAPLDKALIYRYAGIYERALLNKAVEAALFALDTEPGRYEVLMTLGTAYMRLERIDDAVRYVEQAAERYPQRAAVWSLLGQLALARQDVEAAARHFAKAISMEPSNASYLYNYGWLLDQTDRDADAVPYYERAIASSSLSFEAMNNLALIEAAGERSERALILLNRAVVSNPQNEAAYLNRGNYYATLGLWRNAIEDYAHARRLNPLSGYAFVESARAHLELDRADIAIDELSAALDVDPHLEEGYVLLSSAYEKQGRKIESAAALREATRVRERR